jgi:hypothetical protein
VLRVGSPAGTQVRELFSRVSAIYARIGNRFAPHLPRGRSVLAPEQPPDIEVRAASPKDAELEPAGFRAHLLVHNDIDGLGSEAMGSVFCRVEVPYSDGMDAGVRTGEPSPRCPTCRPKT